MPLAAVGLALAAAFLHALWNLLAARSKDTEAAMGVAMSLGFSGGAGTAAAVEGNVPSTRPLTWRVAGARTWRVCACAMWRRPAG